MKLVHYLQAQWDAERALADELAVALQDALGVLDYGDGYAPHLPEKYAPLLARWEEARK